ncbi:alpha/beta hydrolase [Thalassotalea litorea]|uniref:alpha/beta hydrolase n=1 Tax=Thalassotalea litorea TaxID=2020715 RepID=UPI0037360BC8
MAILRLEQSDNQYTPEKLTLLTVHSSHTSRRHSVSIYNAQSTSKDLPVVILMHGVYGDHWCWMHLGGAHVVYERLRQQGLNEFVLVMPSDGGIGDGSGYLPLANGEDYDAWVTDDLRAAVTQTIDGVSAKSRWYISGLSMGGFGALRLSAKYPDKYQGISAHSSVTSIADLKLFTDVDEQLFTAKVVAESELLPWFTTAKNLPPLRLDCGEGDELYTSNLALAKALKDAGIEHSFETFSGGHEWTYWHQHLEDTLNFFNQIELRQ